MKVAVYTHPEFERQFKRYRKKYHSLVDDYAAFLKTIKENPLSGVDLGNGVRKIRMGVASKEGRKEWRHARYHIFATSIRRRKY